MANSKSAKGQTTIYKRRVWR